MDRKIKINEKESDEGNIYDINENKKIMTLIKI